MSPAPHRGQYSVHHDSLLPCRLPRSLVVGIPIVQMAVFASPVDALYSVEESRLVSSFDGFQHHLCAVLKRSGATDEAWPVAGDQLLDFLRLEFNQRILRPLMGLRNSAAFHHQEIRRLEKD